MYKHLLIALAVVLICTNLLQMHRYDELSENCATIIHNLQQRAKECDYYETQHACNVKSVGLRLDTTTVFDVNRMHYRLGDVLTGPSVVCRLSESFCQSCNQYALGALRPCCDSIGFDNVFYLYESDNYKHFRNDIKQLGITEDRAFLCNLDLNGLDDIGFPYILKTNENCEVQLVHVPFKSEPELDAQNVMAMIANSE